MSRIGAIGLRGRSVVLETRDDFIAYTAKVKGSEGFRFPRAFGLGVGFCNKNGDLLNTYFPLPQIASAEHKNLGTLAILMDAVEHLSGTGTYILSSRVRAGVLNKFASFESELASDKAEVKHPNLRLMYKLFGHVPDRMRVVLSFVDQDQHDHGPQGVGDAYLRLHLLSHRLIRPHEIKVSGIFSKMPNVAFTSQGVIDLDELGDRQLEAWIAGRPFTVFSVDKFPRMADYHVPSGVRIADADRVRLGAHVGEGTTVMHEGFINFNAGTLGPAMIEGRISAGVMVGEGSDLGGGSSTMGTLSGGGKEVISVGKDCLIGANAGIGISLGDGCVVEAGLYVTAGMKVTRVDTGEIVKAHTFSGQSGLTFIRNSMSGMVEVHCVENGAKLNTALHKN